MLVLEVIPDAMRVLGRLFEGPVPSEIYEIVDKKIKASNRGSVSDLKWRLDKANTCTHADGDCACRAWSLTSTWDRLNGNWKFAEARTRQMISNWNGHNKTKQPRENAWDCSFMLQQRYGEKVGQRLYDRCKSSFLHQTMVKTLEWKRNCFGIGCG